jgi:nondiscriminating glutamyl-tRNA synthetase
MSFENGRFRFAPSPTGYLHIGGVRTALYNWLLARKHNGKFILRIEDTDKERSTKESMEAILDGFRWLGIDWDEGPEKGGDFGPYFQSERSELYKTEVEKLIASGKAYRCFCTKEELDASKAKAEAEKKTWQYDRKCLALTEQQIKDNLSHGKTFVVRLKVDPADVSFTDLVHGPISFSNNFNFDDFIIVRSDGSPIYNFAVTVDDALMKITHVLRGDDHISNTPRQILIYRALGHPLPEFGHLPMILGPDGSRLSKRHGATAVQQYREAGYLPDALLNFLARLGWSFDDYQEIFPRQELVQKFSLEKVSSSAAVFNQQKLVWLNGEYIKKLSPDEKFQECCPFYVNAGLLTREGCIAQKDLIMKVIELAGDRIKTLDQVIGYTDFFFQKNVVFDDQAYGKLIRGTKAAGFFKEIINAWESMESRTKESVDQMFQSVIARSGLKTKDVMQAVRVALTGRSVSPDLVSIMLLMPPKTVTERLSAVVKKEVG